jgi:transcriptional regulator with XRE-family HTH domain
MDEIIEPTGTLEDSIRELLSDDDEAARAYLKESFLTAAILALFHARRNAGFTQAQLAARLGVKQPTIARLERDFSGSFTLRRYVEVALACGVIPLDLALVATEQLRQFALDDPGAEKTAAAFNAWLAARQPVSLTPVATLQTDVPPTANALPTATPGPLEPNYAAGAGLDGEITAQPSLWSTNLAGIQTGVIAA